MKKFSFKRLINLPMLFLGVAVLIQVLSLIIYNATGIDEFNDTLSKEVIVFSIISIALGVILLLVRLFGFDEAKILLGNFDVFIVLNYILALFAFMFFVISKVNYITNVIVSIDGTKISFIFVFTVIVFLLSFVLFLVSGIMYKRLAKKEEKEGESNEI